MRSLQPRERQLAAIALLITAIAVVWLAIIQPIIGGFVDRAERRRELLQKYARDERLMTQLQSIARAAAMQRREASLFYVPAPDAATASSILTNRLARSAADPGVHILNIEELASSPGQVRMRAQLRTGLPEAIRFIDRVLNGAPLVALDGLAIIADSDADQPHSGQLDVSFEVSASYTAPPSR